MGGGGGGRGDRADGRVQSDGLGDDVLLASAGGGLDQGGVDGAGGQRSRRGGSGILDISGRASGLERISKNQLRDNFGHYVPQ